jgi:site-specific DNA-methyltransferase (adenine-specific)
LKAERNKTIDLDLEQGKECLARCIEVSAPAALSDVLDRTILGDSFKVLPLLPRGFADLLIVDPPYNLSKDFHGSRFARTDEESYEAYTRRWLEACLPLLKPDASVYVCCDWRSSLVIGRVLEEKLTVRNRITWQREKGRGAKKNWKNAMEDIWFATASENYYFDLDAVKQRRRVLAPYRQDGKPKDWEETEDGRFRDTAPSNFCDDISVPYWSMPENTAHPTQKPEKLMAKLILASSAPGDLVFDPFGGSGTTAVTAAKLDRRFTVVEKNPQYCAWTQLRLEKARDDKRIQGFENGVFTKN